MCLCDGYDPDCYSWGATTERFRECNGVCVPENVACEGTCPEGSTPCNYPINGNDDYVACIRSYQEQFCPVITDSPTISSSTPPPTPSETSITRGTFSRLFQLQ